MVLGLNLDPCSGDEVATAQSWHSATGWRTSMTVLWTRARKNADWGMIRLAELDSFEQRLGVFQKTIENPSVGVHGCMG